MASLAYSCPRFGLLHRIPPIPEDREPGAIPLELTEQPEYEEQHLFVPADLTEGIETPEETDGRLRWEQEELERESYARHYPTAVNPTSHSAYDLSSDSKPKVSRYATDSAFVDDVVNVSEVPPPRPAAQGSATKRDAHRPPELPLSDTSRPSMPARTSSSPIPRSITPTQNRSLGSLSGECRLYSLVAFKLNSTKAWGSVRIPHRGMYGCSQLVTEIPVTVLMRATTMMGTRLQASPIPMFQARALPVISPHKGVWQALINARPSGTALTTVLGKSRSISSNVQAPCVLS